jgi:hypothetical protein
MSKNLTVLIFILVKPKIKWNGSIKMDMKEKVGNVRWIHLARNSFKWRVVVNTITDIVLSVN